MYDIVALGELLIDFTEYGKSDFGNALFEQNPGGAPANVLACASKQGCKTAFIGKVGRDIHGDFLRNVLKQVGINTDSLLQDDDAFTTLAFVAINQLGERAFSFARKPGADTKLNIEDIPNSLIESAKIFHFGSLSLTDEPSHSATLVAINRAKSANVIVSYDPNYRAQLWCDLKTAKKTIRSVLSMVDIIKISEEEIELLTDECEVEKAAKTLFKTGIRVVIITLGENGAYVAINGIGSIVPQRFEANVVDTTGAGDAFLGGFLSSYLKSQIDFSNITLKQAMEFADFGNMVACCCVGKRGGISGMPSIDEINLMRTHTLLDRL